MNKDTDIQYIRRLVEKFYHGETSPAEEGVLTHFFRETDTADLPEDLALDAMVFNSLNSLGPDADEMATPENLESKLSAIVHDESSETDHRTFRILPFILKALSTVAAACLIWVLLTRGGNSPDPNAQVNLTAQTEVALIDTIIEEKTEPETEKESTNESPIINQIAKPHLAQNEHKRASQSFSVPSDSIAGPSEGFIEITDPQEARKIMESIGNLLAANLSETDKAITTVNASIETYKELTKNILQ